MPLRLDEIDEIKGCDLAEHGIAPMEVHYPTDVVLKLPNPKNIEEVNISVPVTPNHLKLNNVFNFNSPHDGSMRTRNLAQYNLTFEGDSPSSPKLAPRL